MSACQERLNGISAVVVPVSPEKHSPNDILPVVYELFLVNEGDYDLTDVKLYTGGFEGSDNTVTELNRLTRSLGGLRKGASVLIEDLDVGELDFILWYHFNLTFVDDVKIKSWFQISKAYALRESRYCPALKTEGFHFPLKLRSERKD
jgi:hypothetical protein